MFSDKVAFLVVIDGEKVQVIDQDLMPSDRAILDVVRECGLGDDVFIAYMAETYQYNMAAPEWRRLSGTRNGVWAALFLNSVPEKDQDAWIDLVNELFAGEQSPIDKAFIAWIKGELRLDQFEKWIVFHNAASNKLEIPHA